MWHRFEVLRHRQCQSIAGAFGGRRLLASRIDRSCELLMHISDLTHVLDAAGELAPVKGPARTLAQFLVDVVAHATAGSDCQPSAPSCFKCRKSAVTATRAMDQAIVWGCPACGAEGRISKWQGTLWDLSGRPEAKG